MWLPLRSVASGVWEDSLPAAGSRNSRSVSRARSLAIWAAKHCPVVEPVGAPVCGVSPIFRALTAGQAAVEWGAFPAGQCWEGCDSGSLRLVFELMPAGGFYGCWHGAGAVLALPLPGRAGCFPAASLFCDTGSGVASGPVAQGAVGCPLTMAGGVAGKPPGKAVTAGLGGLRPSYGTAGLASLSGSVARPVRLTAGRRPDRYGAKRPVVPAGCLAAEISALLRFPVFSCRDLPSRQCRLFPLLRGWPRRFR